MISKEYDISTRQRYEFRRSILVVDDEKVNLQIIGRILETEYDLLYAEDGDSAIAITKEHSDRLALILLDLHMDGMHGLEVLDILQKDEELKKIPVIVLTADKNAEVESLRRGAMDFLRKPFDSPGVIRARVSRSIELSVGRSIIDYTKTDPLTGLLTRQYFFQYATEFDRFNPDVPMDAIVVNFTKFHLINDLYGRSFGDEVLKNIAEGLNCSAQSCQGFASRIEADTFYVYITHRDDYSFLINTVKKSLEPIMRHSDIKLRVGIYQNAGRKETLYQCFDKALIACNTHYSKKQKDEYMLYDTKMHEREIYEAKLLEGVEQAFREKQFSIVMQPKYDIREEMPRLCSAEVLVRWTHPEYGKIRPDYFIRLFEDNGMIKELDRYVWTKAAAQLGEWKKKYGAVPPLSVNVSRVDIFDPDLSEFLLQIINENGLEPSDLHLEITETAYTDNTSQILKVIKKLQGKGFKIEMDDFGKGYSSLNMLTCLPIDVLKLDMEFIRNIDGNNKKLKMVGFIIEIGKFLKVPVVAEGVESREQYRLLKEAGCDVIQGYYFSRPLRVEEFEKLLEK